MKPNDFDKLASIYDHLTKLVFGRSIINSQKYFLNKISDRSSVLILGGGTGWIVKELLKVKSDVTVCYIEASAKMITIAKEKLKNDKRVQFINGTENDIPSDAQFDFVITNFYLDLFTDESLKIVVERIKKSLSPQAKWIVTDFINSKWWHGVMLKAMYFFFYVTCNIEPRSLPEWSRAIQAIGAAQLDSKIFYRGFIKTTIFQL
jgi:ubiquinone/menaquinone biosynthesis C-methylase UbiE